jgi:hypothetical protein
MDDLTGLRGTLASLSRAESFARANVVVAHDDRMLATVQVVQDEFGMRRFEVIVRRI